ELLCGSVPALRPQMSIAGPVDQLRRYADLVAFTLDGALEDISGIQIPGDLPQIDQLAVVDVGRVASNHVHLAIARQIIDDVLGQPVGEPSRRLVTRNIGEWQHGERRPPSETSLVRPKIPGTAAGQHEDQRYGYSPPCAMARTADPAPPSG